MQPKIHSENLVRSPLTMNRSSRTRLLEAVSTRQLAETVTDPATALVADLQGAIQPATFQHFFSKVAKVVCNFVSTAVDVVADLEKAVAKLGLDIVELKFSSIFKDIKKVWGAVKKAWKKLGSYLMMAAMIGCMVVPGLQVVSLALAAYQAYKSGKLLVKGIKDGNFNEILMGAAGVATAFAGGVSALGTKLMGAGLEAAATTVGKVADIASKVASAAEAIKTGNPGLIVGAAAGAVGAGAGFVSAAAGKLAQKIGTSASKFVNVGEDVAKGDIADGLAAGTGLAGQAVDHFGGDQTTATDLEEASGLIFGGIAVDNAVKTGNIQGISDSMAGLAALGESDLGNQQTADSILKGAAVVDEVAAINLKVTPLARIAAGGLAVAAGVRYLTMSKEQRAAAVNGAKNSVGDDDKGSFRVSGLDLAQTAGFSDDSEMGKFLGNAANFVANKPQNISEDDLDTLTAAKMQADALLAAMSAGSPIDSDSSDNAINQQ